MSTQIKFIKKALGYSQAKSLSLSNQGYIYFDSTSKRIYVDGQGYGSDIIDVTLTQLTGNETINEVVYKAGDYKLTVTKIGGDTGTITTNYGFSGASAANDLINALNVEVVDYIDVEAATVNGSTNGKKVTFKHLKETAGLIGLHATGKDELTISGIGITGKAEDGFYSNEDSGLTASNIQAAIDELADSLSSKQDAIIDGSANVPIATESEGVITIYKQQGVSQNSGAIGSNSNTENTNKITLATVAKTGAAEDVSVTSTSFTATNVSAALEELAGSISDVDVPEYTIAVATTTDGALKSYQLTKDGTPVGAKIDIPKDYLVKSGTIETVSTADAPYTGAAVGDKYLDFVINVYSGTATDEHIYIPVKSLVDVYTNGRAITVGSDNKVSIDTTKFSSSTGITVENNGTDGVAINLEWNEWETVTP